MPDSVSVKIRRETLEQLAVLKEHPRETYNDVISRLIRQYKAKAESQTQGNLITCPNCGTTIPIKTSSKACSKPNFSWTHTTLRPRYFGATTTEWNTRRNRVSKQKRRDV